MATTNPSGGRLAEQNHRLRVRLERLQRLLDAAGGFEAADTGQAKRPIVSIPTNELLPMHAAPAIGDFDGVRAEYVGEHDPRRRLLPYPGHANASAAEFVSTCIGLNLIGASRTTWRNVVQQLQKTLDRRRGHTFVCVTDDADTGYFIKRGITFEYIGYTHRLGDPGWQAYFQMNMDLLKKKYGIGEFVTIAAGRAEA
jgi:hypothetical protein